MIVEVLMLCLLALLVIAVIGLFAMMGELNSRVPAAPGDEAGVTIWPAQRARLGPLSSWPQELDSIVRDGGAVVAFSTNCSTCRKVLSEDPNHLGVQLPTAVVVVAGDESSGRAFVKEHPVLSRVPVHIDPDGTWLREAVGLDSSPAVFTVRAGEVLAAYNFNRSSALAGLATAPTEESRNA